MCFVPLALACIVLPPFLCPLRSSRWVCFISGNPGTFGAPCSLVCDSFVSRPFTTQYLSIPSAASAPSSRSSSFSSVLCWHPSSRSLLAASANHNFPLTLHPLRLLCLPAAGSASQQRSHATA